MSARPAIPPGSRAVLIGVPDYQDVRYASYPAVGNSIDGMCELLVESGLCGWSEDQVSKIVNPANSGQLLGRLRRLARDTANVLLLYFVGHGVMSEQGELCLAISDTDHDVPDATGLEYTKIRRMLHSGTTATTKIVILDCCYSGRAIGMGSPAQTQLADLSQAPGVYTLTAADDLASAASGIEDATCTAFTGELLDFLMRDGIPGGPAGLTLGEIYPHLRGRLSSKCLPRPNQRADDQAAAFVFASNAAVPQPPVQFPAVGASIAPLAKAADQLGRNWALLIWRRAGHVRSDPDGRLYGDTGQGEDIQFAADRMYWPCADWREPGLKAEVIIEDGKVKRIREVYGIDRAATLDASHVALRVSPPLNPDEITARLPTLSFKLDDELPAVRGKSCEYRSYPGAIERHLPPNASAVSSAHRPASSSSDEAGEQASGGYDGFTASPETPGAISPPSPARGQEPQQTRYPSGMESQTTGRRIRGIACAPIGGRPHAITWDNGADLDVWDLDRRAWSRCISLGEQPVLGPKFGAVAATDNHPVFVGYSESGKLMWLELDADEPEAIIAEVAGPAPSALAVSEVGSRPVAVTGHRNGDIRLWDLRGGCSPLGEPLPGHGEPVRSIACTMLDGRPVAVSGSGMNVGATAGPTPSGGGFAPGVPTGTVHLWDLSEGCRTGQSLRTGWVSAIDCAVIRDRPVAVISDRDSVRIWDLRDQAEWATRVPQREAKTLTCGLLDGRPVIVLSTPGKRIAIWEYPVKKPGGPFVTYPTRLGKFRPRRKITALTTATVGGRSLVLGAAGTELRAWDIGSAETSTKVELPASKPTEAVTRTEGPR